MDTETIIRACCDPVNQRFTGYTGAQCWEGGVNAIEVNGVAVPSLLTMIKPAAPAWLGVFACRQ